MAAYTAAQVSFSEKDEVHNDRKRRTGKLTLPASYTTGGDVLSAAVLNLPNTLKTLRLTAVTLDGTTLVVWDEAAGKVKCYSALGTQVTNATDLSGKSCLFEATGW